MKYIRTKNSVYSETQYKVAKAFVSMFEEEQAKLMPTQKTNFNIINQADTIEELCDEFVLETTINDKLFCAFFREHKTAKMSKYEMFKESWEIFNGYPQEIKDKKIHNYYGAIWTDKGLIYVAKMNDKGELELL